MISHAALMYGNIPKSNNTINSATAGNPSHNASSGGIRPISRPPMIPPSNQLIN